MKRALVGAGVALVVATAAFIGWRARYPREPRAPGPVLANPVVGSAVCEPCHRTVHAEWSASFHGRHMAAPSPQTVLGDFTDRNTLEYAGTRSRMFRDGDRWLMEHRGPDGLTGTHAIDFALGVARHQVYLHRLPDGRLQVLPTYWNVEEGRWRDAREGPVTAGPVPLPPTDREYWRNYGRTYNYACLECHASQPDKRYDAATNTYDSRFDPAINCEACHGAAGVHALLWRDHDGPAGDAVDDSLPRLGALPQAARIEQCAVCHASKRTYALGYTPGAPYFDFYAPDLWSRDGSYFVDGRSANLNYHYADFLLSRCVRDAKRKPDCAQPCHPPHSLASARGRSVGDANAMCTGCHVKHGAALRAHTFHAPESDGSRCVACHMPKIALGMYMSATDHSIGSPLPELTRQYGVPNACNQCHQNDSPEWAEHHVERWYGGSPRFAAYRARMQERAAVLSAVFAGAPVPVEPLIRWLDDAAESIVVRAGAALFLGDAPADPTALAALLRHADDPHPLVRFYVISGLSRFRQPPAGAALRAALRDPRRIVRVRAYGTLVLFEPGLRADASPEVARAREEHTLHHDVIRVDDPRLLGHRALWHAGLGELAEAERQLRRGVALSGNVPDLRADLVHLLLETGRLDEAERELATLVETAPDTLETGLSRAAVHLARGRAAEAVAECDRLIAAGHDGPAVRQLRAVALQR